MQHLLQKTSKSWTLSLILLTVSGIASANCELCYIPYAGVDAQMRHISFQKNFGGNILKKRYPQGNVFGGFLFTHCLGLEAGYEFSKKQLSTKNSVPNDIIFGINTPTITAPSVINTVDRNRASSKITGWNLNLVGLLPILCEEDNVQLIGSVGVAHLKLRVRNVLTHSEVEFNDPFVRNPNDTFTVARTVNTVLKNRRAVLRLASGIQHALTDYLSFRALVSWENTAKLEAKAIDTSRIGTPVGTRVVRMSAPQNSLQFSLGVFTLF